MISPARTARMWPRFRRFRETAEGGWGSQCAVIVILLFSSCLVIANARVEVQTQREEAVVSTLDATLIGRQVADEVVRDHVNA